MFLPQLTQNLILTGKFTLNPLKVKAIYIKIAPRIPYIINVGLIVTAPVSGS